MKTHAIRFSVLTKHDVKVSYASNGHGKYTLTKPVKDKRNQVVTKMISRDDFAKAYDYHQTLIKASA